MILRKWFSMLLLLGFAAPTLVFAQDDDEDEYYEDEEEEAPPKKAKKEVKKAAKKSSEPDVPGRVGLSVSFGGSDGTVGLVYDLGSGLEFGLGVGFYRHAYTPDQGDAPDPVQTINLVPSIKFALGKELLTYGLGADVGITSKEAGTDIRGFLNFYASAELVKNLSLTLSTGVRVDKLQYDAGSDLDINLGTRGAVIFYFM